MSANSKHYGDVTLWLINVIMSCVTHDQHFNARAMIRRFQHEQLERYNLPENVEQEIQHRLDKAIEDGFDLYLKNKHPELVSPEDTSPMSMGDNPPPGEDNQPLSMGDDFPYSDPWWGSSPKDKEEWMKLNDEHKKLIEYWRKKPTRPSVRTIPEWTI